MAISKKSGDQLILEDKLDAARARINLEARRWARRQKNETEHAIKVAHWKQLKAGKVKELGE